jgi:hypothetical protein
MPLLSRKEKDSIYETFLAIQPQKGKWIKLVRIPLLIPGKSTYASYGDDARQLALWANITLSTNEKGISYISFGTVILEETLAMIRAKKYRAIIVDAPTGLATG